MAGLEGTWLGSYHLLRHVGGGGMSDVYLAEQRGQQRQAAVKTLHSANLIASTREQRQAIQQFLTEARMAAALKHPNLVPIYDFGEQNSVYYLAMEYMPFGSLADFLTFGPMQGYRLPLPVPLVADLINQAAGALQFAHDQRVVHLDVKPQNLLLKVLPLANTPSSPAPGQSGSQPYQVPTGEIPVQLQLMVADLSLSRLMNWLAFQRGVPLAPLYMAPEQFMGRPGPATDQYALACVAYLLLTGETVFKGAPPELHQQHLSAPPRLATEINPQLPPAVNGVLAQALAKEPMRRYPRIQEFGQALKQAASASGQWQTYSLPMSAVGPLLASAPAAALLAQPPAAPQPEAVPVPSAQTPAWPGSVPPLQGMPASAPQGNQAVFLDSQPTSGPTVVPPGWAQVPSPRDQWADAETIHGSLLEAPAPTPGTPSGPSPHAAASSGSSPYAAAPANQAQLNARAFPGTTQYREPDAPRAPLPPSAQKFIARRQFPLWQKLALGLLTLLLIAGAVAAVFLVFLHRPASPTSSQVHVTTQSLTRYGVQSAANFPALAGTPPALGKVIMRQRTAPPPAQPHFNNNLPVLSVDIAAHAASSSYPANLPVPKNAAHPIEGLGQQQMGNIDAPIDVSVATNGSTVIEVVDGALLEVKGSTSRGTALANFFQQPLSQQGGVLAEPRILFAIGLGKWILVVNQLTIGSDGAINAGSFDVAISQTTDPAGNWDIYQLNTRAAAYAGCTWADYPQIGATPSDVFITGTSFDCGLNGTLRGADLWDIPLSNLSATQALETIYVATGFTTSQGNPLVTLTPAVQVGQGQTEWLVSNDAGYVGGDQVSKQVTVWAVIGNNQGGKVSAPAIVHSAVSLTSPYADPPLTSQLNSNFRLSMGDARIAQAEFINGHLYAAFTTAVNWANDTTTRAGIYWMVLTPTLTPRPDPTKSVLSVYVFQQGLFGAPISSFFYPALVADSAENVVLFSEVCGPKLEPSLIFTSRLSGDPVGTMGGRKNSFLFLPGDTAVYRGSHWGDYVGAGLAPTSSNGKSASIWIAGPRVASDSGLWHTDLWNIPVKEA